MCAGVGAYARVRKQFRVPIAEFGGIQEALARAGRESYIVLAGTELTNAIVDNHEAPMVLSSVATGGESHITVFASVWFLTSVGPLVHLEVRFGLELFTTNSFCNINFGQ